MPCIFQVKPLTSRFKSSVRVRCTRSRRKPHSLCEYIAYECYLVLIYSAAVILSAVGSTGTTALRPAGLPEPRIFEGKFEVVSFSGTIGPGSHHLHMSISDPECQVFGGHVMPGCVVRTTLEVVIGIIDSIRFNRPKDIRTGYHELSIDNMDDLVIAKRARK